MMHWLDTLAAANRPADLLLEADQRPGAIPTVKDKKTFYFSGWLVEKDKNVVWHNGEIIGFKSGVFMHVDSGVKAVFIFANNRFSKDEETMIDAWEDFFTKRKYVLPTK
jgi:hypothetical protein